MARSHWIAFGACPVVLALIASACSSSSTPQEPTDETKDSGVPNPVDSGTPTPVDSGGEPDTGPVEVPIDPNAAGGVSDTALNFGTVDCEKTATAKTFSITNPSTTGAIVFSAVLGKSSDSPFTISPTDGKILLGQRAIVTITPKKIPRGTETSPTSTATNGQGDSVTIVAGTATLNVGLLQTARGAILTYNPIGVNFRNSPLAAGTIAQEFGIQNDGNVDAPLTLTAAGPSFALGTPGNVTTTTALAATQAALSTAYANFTPTAVQAYAGSVTMTLSAAATPLCADLPTTPLSLAGAGVESVVGLSTASLLFPTTDCGKAAPAQALTITNYGGTSFKVTSLALGRGTSSPYNAINPSATPIAANGGTATYTVTPKTISSTAGVVDENAYGDTLTVTTDLIGDTPHPVDLHMSARGVIIARSPTGTVGFGNIGRGNTGTQKVTYTNTGNVDVTFNVTHPSTNFGAPAQVTIGHGLSTDANYTFTPDPAAVTNVGYSDTLTFGRADLNVPICQTVGTTPLSGTGVAPLTTASPTGTQDFGFVGCGALGGAKTLTYTNNGPAIHWTATMRKTDSSQFTINPTAGDLPPGGSVGVTITPKAIPTSLTSMAAITDVLDFTSGYVPTQATISTTMAVTPQGAFIAWLNNANGGIAAYNYGTKKIIDPATTYAFGIKNTGNLAATFAFAFAPGASDAFALGTATSDGDVVTNSSFSPIHVTFKPITAGPQSATLQASSATAICNAQVTSASLVLTGTGQ